MATYQLIGVAGENYNQLTEAEKAQVQAAGDSILSQGGGQQSAFEAAQRAGEAIFTQRSNAIQSGEEQKARDMNSFIASNTNASSLPSNIDPTGQYSVVNGVLTQKSAISADATNKAGVANGTLVEVAPGMYAPKGSAAEANMPNIGTHNTSIEANKNLPPPTFTPVGSGVPTAGGTSPVLPVGSSSTMTTAYYGSLAQQTQSAQVNLDNMRNQQLQQIQQDKQAAQDALQQTRDMQGDAINEQGNVAMEEKKMILDRLAIEEARFNENYNIAQGLTTKLTDLMTEGNNLIAMVSGKTGLSGIRNPRINQAINAVTAAVGVVKAGLDAANGQMGAAQDQLQTATNTITAAYTDQIDYYKSLNTYYESVAGDNQAEVVQLSKDERAYLDSKIDELTAERDRLQKNSDALQAAMQDPDSALAYATAGVTLMDTPQQIGAKLAKYAYSKELSEQSKEMANGGWTPLISGNAPTGSTTTQRIDSQGKVKTYYKKGTSTGPSGNIDVLDIGRLQEQNPNAGINYGDSQATVIAKINAVNSPEGKARVIIQAAKAGGATYKEVVKDLGNDQLALGIAKEVYGVTDKPAANAAGSSSGSKSEFNPKTGKIEQFTINPITGKKEYKSAESSNKIDFSKIDYGQIKSRNDSVVSGINSFFK